MEQASRFSEAMEYAARDAGNRPVRAVPSGCMDALADKTGLLHRIAWITLSVGALIFSTGCASPDGGRGSLKDGLAAYDRKDYPTALEAFQSSAEQNNSRAQFTLGTMYELGQGVPKDNGIAVRWFRAVGVLQPEYQEAQKRIMLLSTSSQELNGLLWGAVYTNSAPDAELILKRTVALNVDAKDSYGTQTPLLAYAARNGMAEVVRLMIARGANVNAADTEGFSALMEAASNGNVDSVKRLVASGANVNAASKSGWTALHGAAMRGHQSALEYLVAQGANLNAVSRENGDFHSGTALHQAAFAQVRKYPDPANRPPSPTVQFLKSKGANANIRDQFGFTPAEPERSMAAQGVNLANLMNQWKKERAEQDLAAKQKADEAERQANANRAASAEECGWACQNARRSQEDLKKMQDADSARRNRDAKAACQSTYGTNSSACR
ncbi:MAG: ankyrin repeat domain-containing protein [Rhodoferax sp.]|nr:ankyrin repeat domain-containing protein [Rhodoferax sp.]